jgi:hypothetical protein
MVGGTSPGVDPAAMLAGRVDCQAETVEPVATQYGEDLDRAQQTAALKAFTELVVDDFS